MAANKTHAFTIAASGAILALGLGACSSAPTAEQSEAPATSVSPSTSPSPTTEATDAAGQPSANAASAPGSRVDYAEYAQDPGKYADTDVVLHFSAEWCPSCVQTNESLKNDGVPAGLTVVTVDFDDSQDVKQKYGVTTQHTFVQIDKDGNEQTKFTGALTGTDIQENLV